ncbi:transposon Ty3-G Gag-Pol polyprotein [Nephila pilipes]|uniref:Transposon Ty3-G Gag-Pol polyprotein n=1 Tax=Nephila pilipes TaxID=299642 RepID=A0A8X6TD66_NEPPI|nr:transposon Ty3-G Gag-Pol polyprotein [Nephila pilipes]
MAFSIESRPLNLKAFSAMDIYKYSENFPNKREIEILKQDALALLGELLPFQQEDRPPVKCYGCGTSGFIRAKCPNCTAEPKTETSRFKFLEASSCFVTTASVSTVYLRINGIFGKACADTGSSHSIAGETLYTLLKDEGAKFRNGTICISLADGQRSTEDVLITTVTLDIEGWKFDQELIALPNAKRNRTLLGIDFLKKSGIMLDLRNQQWFFADMPQKQFAFGEHANDQHPVDNLDVNLCTLREEEGRCLNITQKEKLFAVLKKYASVFEPGGEPTPYIEHRINTGDSPYLLIECLRTSL